MLLNTVYLFILCADICHGVLYQVLDTKLIAGVRLGLKNLRPNISMQIAENCIHYKHAYFHIKIGTIFHYCTTEELIHDNVFSPLLRYTLRCPLLCLKEHVCSEGHESLHPRGKKLQVAGSNIYYFIVDCCCSVLAGTIVGTLSLGGGFILTPLFLEMGIPPQEFKQQDELISLHMLFFDGDSNCLNF